MGWGHPPVGVVSNRVMVAVYVVRREGVIRMYPMREDLRGFSQRLKRFYKKRVSTPCLEDAVLQPPVLQDSPWKKRGCRVA